MNSDFERAAAAINQMLREYASNRGRGAKVDTSSDDQRFNGPECERLLGVTHIIGQICAGLILQQPDHGAEFFNAVVTDLTSHMKSCFQVMAITSPQEVMEFADMIKAEEGYEGDEDDPEPTFH